MLILLIIAAALFFFDYVPSFKGQIKDNKKDFLVFLCLALIAVTLIAFQIYDIKLPDPMRLIEELFESLGLTYRRAK